MQIDTLRNLYIHELRDLYSAEKQLLKALPKMARKATNPQLRQAFELHTDQTREHVDRLAQIFELAGARATGAKCAAMQGLIEEAEEFISDADDKDVLDAGMIGQAQRVEHYEIAAYGTARTYAQLLGDEQAANLLQQTLDEEGDTDKKLTHLATSMINIDAMESDTAEAGMAGSQRGRSSGRSTARSGARSSTRSGGGTSARGRTRRR